MEDQFAMLCGLGRRVTDYGADKHASAGGKQMVLSIATHSTVTPRRALQYCLTVYFH